MDYSPPSSSIRGILWTRILKKKKEYWSGLPCPFLQGIFLSQGSNSCLLYLLHWQAGSLPPALSGKPFCLFVLTWKASICISILIFFFWIANNHLVQNAEATKEYTVRFPTPASTSPLQRLRLSSVFCVFLVFFRLKCCEELLSHTERASPVLSRVAWIWLNPSLFNQAPLDGELFGRSQSSSVTAIAAINGECGVFVTCKAI